MKHIKSVGIENKCNEYGNEEHDESTCDQIDYRTEEAIDSL